MCYRSRHIIKAFLPEYWRTESKWVSFSCLIKIMLILLIRKKSETLFYDLKEIVRQVLGIKRSHYSRIFTWGQATLSTTAVSCAEQVLLWGEPYNYMKMRLMKAKMRLMIKMVASRFSSYSLLVEEHLFFHTFFFNLEKDPPIIFFSLPLIT